MPFLGQDWRSEGEQWVKTTEGWERLKWWRLKLLENLNENVVSRLLRLTNSELSRSQHAKGTCSQPYVYVTKRVSKERKMQMSIAEAMSRLDMNSAAKDMRRCHYVCKLLEFLIKQKMSGLSGTGQKIVFNLMEEVLNQTVKTHNNIHTVQNLLNETRKALERSDYDHVGSSSLWTRHRHSVDRLQNSLSAIQLKEREDDGKMTMSDMPDDILREILQRLDNHRDLMHTGLTECRTFELCQERAFWQDLCLYHFTKQQWLTVIRRGEDMDSVGWKKLYYRLVRRYGLKDVYAEMLHLCRHCTALYWELHGHPCLMSNLEPESIPVSPAMCVELFTS